MNRGDHLLSDNEAQGNGQITYQYKGFAKDPNTENLQSTNRGFIEDSDRSCKGLTNNSQKTHGEFTEDSQPIYREVTQDL